MIFNLFFLDLNFTKTNNNYEKITLPKSIVAMAGASAMILSTRFVIVQPEVEEFDEVKMEEFQGTGTPTDKSYYCETAGEYLCMPTWVVEV